MIVAAAVEQVVAIIRSGVNSKEIRNKLVEGREGKERAAKGRRNTVPNGHMARPPTQ